MNTMKTNRRALLGSLVVAPAAIAALPATGMTFPVRDEAWTTLVADYRMKLGKRQAAIEAECRDMDKCREARGLLPPKPQEPGSGLPNDILGMTIAEIKAVGDDPAHKAEWAAYERDRAAWQAEWDALSGTVFDSSIEAHSTCNAALDALCGYRVASLAQLREKFEIIAAEYRDCDIPEAYFAHMLVDVVALASREA